MSNKEQSPNYWKSLNELANNEEYKNYLEREFPEGASELKDGMTRKNFLRIMGASIALAGFAACRRPVEKILPYRTRPEGMDPSNPWFYATAMPYRGALTGLVVKTVDGRPIKIEGNKQHPGSLGSTNAQNQAAMLGLYDPDRSRTPKYNGQNKSWDDFLSFANQYFTSDKKVAFLSSANSSMTLNSLKKDALKKFKNARWVTYEPYGEQNVNTGNSIAFGKKLRTYNHFDQAHVIVSLDADFLQDGAENTINIWNFAKGRKLRNPGDSLNSLYVVENNYSLTGSNADNRLRILSSQVEAFTYALAASLAQKVNGLEAYKDYKNDFSQHSWISVLTEELLNNKGKSIVVAGNHQNPNIHAAVAAMNLALGNAGNTVSYYNVPTFVKGDDNQNFIELVKDLKAGKYDALVMLDTNPVYTAPADLDFASALEATKMTVQLAEYYDETSRKVKWHINKSHFLEYWGDGTSFNGVQSVIQPMILPLFGGKSQIEVLNAIITGKDTKGYDLVQDTWKPILGGANFKNKWEKVLNDGVLDGSGFKEENIRLATGYNKTIKTILSTYKSPSNNQIELVIKPDPKIVDGRYANIGWLQEMPDPITKITWGNVALMSLKTAATFGLKNGDMIKVKASGTEILIPAWVLPGHADNSITVYTGYGRHGIGRIADDDFGVYIDHNYGVASFMHQKVFTTNVFPLLLTTHPLFHNNVTIVKTGKTYTVANTQDHGSMEGRPIVREANISEYRKKPKFASEMVDVEGTKEEHRKYPEPIFTPAPSPSYEPQWAMTIDLTKCVGCGTCTIACQAENNIPIVGKQEVTKGREMHWIRTDRYFVGDADNPKIAHQPVPCMQCELAPCEEVCPVAATTHSNDGINQMVYNRCIGTRYCLNNCPYKVRRFNFFNFSKEFLTTGKDPEIIQMAMNPQVTVRFRGVMEKCTYCVQRLQRAKIKRQLETQNQSMKPLDGTVKTACQQACPADAIRFGDITDPNSKVSLSRENDRNYTLLSVLDTRPRTTYQAKVRNPNEKLT